MPSAPHFETLPYKTLPFKTIDAFANLPLRGLPIAVVLVEGSASADPLSEAQMQAIARWTNLAETAFLMPALSPKSTVRFRAFSPREELFSAPAAALSSVRALLEDGEIQFKNDEVVLDGPTGPLTVYRNGEILSYVLPSAAANALNAQNLATLDEILGATLAVPQLVKTDAAETGWLVAALPSQKDLFALSATPASFERLSALFSQAKADGLAIFAPLPDGDGIAVRTFAFASGSTRHLEEVPVSPNGNGCIAFYCRANHLLPPLQREGYTACQGQNLGRNAEFVVSYAPNEKILIGGVCVMTLEGRLRV